MFYKRLFSTEEDFLHGEDRSSGQLLTDPEAPRPGKISERAAERIEGEWVACYVFWKSF